MNTDAKLTTVLANPQRTLWVVIPLVVFLTLLMMFSYGVDATTAAPAAFLGVALGLFVSVATHRTTALARPVEALITLTPLIAWAAIVACAPFAAHAAGTALGLLVAMNYGPFLLYLFPIDACRRPLLVMASSAGAERILRFVDPTGCAARANTQTTLMMCNTAIRRHHNHVVQWFRERGVLSTLNGVLQQSLVHTAVASNNTAALDLIRGANRDLPTPLAL